MIKSCKYCGTEYVAKTTVSRYCSEKCNKKQYYTSNKVKILKKDSVHYTLNKETKKNYNKKYYELNSSEIKAKKVNYRKENRNKINTYNYQYYKNIENRLRKNLRSRLSCAIKNNQKSGSAISDLGCSIEEFKKHVESKFLPEMAWNNWSYNGWHIDHIKPLASFDLTKEEELKKACHYSNLQPLWQPDNFKKGAK